MSNASLVTLDELGRLSRTVRQLRPAQGGQRIRLPAQRIDVPAPVSGPTEVLVRTLCSAISPATERAFTALAQSSLIAKARARPDRSVVPSAGREWVEVHAGSHRVTVDDFRIATFDGRRIWRGRHDKGHSAPAAAFRKAVTGGADLPTHDILATTWAAAGHRFPAGRGGHG